MTAMTAFEALISLDEGHDGYADRILEAALDQFAIHGIRRTSVEDVATAANVGRVTVYRRFANKDALVQAAVVRHLHRLHRDIAASTTLPEPCSEGIVDLMVEWFVAAIHRVRDDRLVRRLLETEPETVFPLVTTRAAPLLMAATEMVLATYPGMREAMGEQATVLTELSARLATSLVVCPDGFANSGTPAETRELANLFLAPALRAHLQHVKTKG